jgi:hypothetical protein
MFKNKCVFLGCLQIVNSWSGYCVINVFQILVQNGVILTHIKDAATSPSTATVCNMKT